MDTGLESHPITGRSAEASFGRHAVASGRAEVAAVIAGAALPATFAAPGLPAPLVVALSAPFVVAMLAWIAAADWRRRVVPDGPTAAVALVGAASRLALAYPPDMGTTLIAVALDGLLWGGAFWLVREAYFRRHGFDGLGFGDVKLAAACGMLVGLEGFAWALLAASLAGLTAAGLAALRGVRLQKIPFGAFLAPVCCATWLLQALF